MALRVLYHGTDVESAKMICGCGNDLDKCSDKTDFGKGFYTTDDYKIAVNWANRKARVRTSRPAVVTLWFDAEFYRKYFKYELSSANCFSHFGIVELY